jgi:predicted dehydrogenase
MSDRIRIGIVGCGRILPAHLRGYRLLREAGVDSFRITGLVARDPRDAEMFRRRGQGPVPRLPVAQNPNDPLSAPHAYVSDFQDDVEAQVYTSVDEMLADGKVDALDIPATLHVHHSAALAGLRAGKHCLVQKPLAISVKAARLMVDEARQRNLRLGVVENVRYQEGVRIQRWIVESGYLGDIQLAAWWSIGSGEWSPDKIVAQTPWRHQKLLGGGGASLDIGVHWFHRLRYVVGEVESVFAQTRICEPRRYMRSETGAIVGTVDCDVDDAFFANVRFVNQAMGQLSFTWAGHGEVTNLPEGLVLYGSRGCLKGDRLVRDGGGVQSARALFAAHATDQDRERFFPFGLRDTFAIGALDFLRGIESGRDPEASGEEGLRDLAASFAICESALAGRSIDLSAMLSGEVDAYQAPINRHYRL